MKRFTFLFPLTLLLVFAAQAATPVWSTNVAPILYNHCTSCHHAGGIAPFALMTYSEAQAQAASIKADVNSLKMPPWPPSPAYSHFAHERVLSAAEVATINDWVNGGAPSGDITLAPPLPVYSTTGILPGTPDLVVKIPTYTSTATSTTGDVYQCFAIPSGLLADKYITAIEAIPGNSQIVHHVLVYADTSGDCANLDSLSTGPGYPGFGGVGSASAKLIGAWVPGSTPTVFPNGFGVKLYNRSDIVLQIHYPAGSSGMSDSTEVHFFFATGGAPRDLYIEPILNYWTNITPTLYIPANTVKSFYERAVIPANYSLLAVAPHMHLLGKSISSYVLRPTGDTDKLINIPDWDFHWQGFYTFPRFKKVPSGSTLRADASYDNTTANPDNPSHPPVGVGAGENTTDEMMVVYYIFAQYQAGDENIIIDSAVALNTPKELSNYYRGQQLLDVYPNPAVKDIVIKCYFNEADIASIDLIDMQGKLVKRLKDHEQVSKGYNAFTFSAEDIPEGCYSLSMQTTERVLNQKVVITH